MLGAETVIGPILKVVVTVAVLAAVGIFIVKPILDTTEEISRDVNESVRQSIEDSRQASEDASEQGDRMAAGSYAASLQSQWPAAARAVRQCVADANSSAGVHACRELGERLVHTVLSDRLFALSYADSLETQGETDDAARVRDCVKHAGFQTAAMQRCRDLADELLFG